MTEQFLKRCARCKELKPVRDYCRYWDEWETDDGFELPEMSTAARIVWNHIKRDLAESNKRYFLNKGKQKR